MIVGGYALAAHGLPRATGFGYLPYRVDILTPMPVIGRDDLIVNKRAAGCRQDLADVERLTKFSNEDPHAHG